MHFWGPWAGLGPGEGSGRFLGGRELSSTTYSSKICVFGILPAIPGIPRIPRIPADPGKVVAASAAQTLPSTRAGGQDDVSLNKLPQIIGDLNLEPTQQPIARWIALGALDLADEVGGEEACAAKPTKTAGTSTTHHIPEA